MRKKPSLDWDDERKLRRSSQQLHSEGFSLSEFVPRVPGFVSHQCPKELGIAGLVRKKCVRTAVFGEVPRRFCFLKSLIFREMGVSGLDPA